MTSPQTGAGFESPSLVAPVSGAGPAFELKFLLPESQGQEVEAWVRSRLALDPHGDPALDGAYRTTSLYCDTPEQDVYHRTPTYKRRKFRVRRYDAAPWVFLERKSKKGDRVAKRRVAVPDEELPQLTHPMSVLSWTGHWFHRSLRFRRLQPACLIAYQRTAFVGPGPHGPLRLTMDRRIRGILSNNWHPVPFEGGVPLLIGQTILELKFRMAMPTLFKELVQTMRLNPGTVSKYRLCREVLQVAATQTAHRETANA